MYNNRLKEQINNHKKPFENGVTINKLTTNQPSVTKTEPLKDLILTVLKTITQDNNRLETFTAVNYVKSLPHITVAKYERKNDHSNYSLPRTETQLNFIACLATKETTTVVVINQSKYRQSKQAVAAGI
ncbi:hypothetical protein Tsp_08475 [Trichinella spiralis]|uniref:hypothetical protein n=1 Tax=Trichinella spiralis TaxID=6334 RepID=UPI0001EFB79B|nr:hypothetical protein Tsp_08475 [Trichinella spiralis]